MAKLIKRTVGQRLQRLLNRWDDAKSSGQPAEAYAAAAALVRLINEAEQRPQCAPGLWDHFKEYCYEQKIVRRLDSERSTNQ